MPSYFHDVAPEAGGDSVLRRLQGLDLTNQLNRRIRDENLEGKVVLVDFFCRGAGKQQADRLNYLRQIQLAFAKSDSSLQLLSIGLGPGADSLSVLRQVADSFHADPDSWWLARGSRKEVYGLFGRLMGTAVPDTSIRAADLYARDRWVLLDKHRFVRGYYSGLDSADLRHCLRDISLLMVEREKH